MCPAYQGVPLIPQAANLSTAIAQIKGLTASANLTRHNAETLLSTLVFSAIKVSVSGAQDGSTACAAEIAETAVVALLAVTEDSSLARMAWMAVISSAIAGLDNTQRSSQHLDDVATVAVALLRAIRGRLEGAAASHFAQAVIAMALSSVEGRAMTGVKTALLAAAPAQSDRIHRIDSPLNAQRARDAAAFQAAMATDAAFAGAALTASWGTIPTLLNQPTSVPYPA